MTSKEIRKMIGPIREWDSRGDATDLRLAVLEIAYQLGLANEREDSNTPTPKNSSTRPADAAEGKTYEDLVDEFRSWRIKFSGVDDPLSVDIRVALRFMYNTMKVDSHARESMEPERKTGTNQSKEPVVDQIRLRDVARKTDREQS